MAFPFLMLAQAILGKSPNNGAKYISSALNMLSASKDKKSKPNTLNTGATGTKAMPTDDFTYR